MFSYLCLKVGAEIFVKVTISIPMLCFLEMISERSFEKKYD
jgi:hypothetical protein